ncbi:MAG: hypothetical protein JNG88_10760 [Phycisphaerales bacterium]|nr:hypothetical protein [Phycisphaerales bacterium]
MADVYLQTPPPSILSATRRYGHGSSVTLRAPNLEPTLLFKYWTVDSAEIVPPNLSDPRQLTIQMLNDHEAVPVYVIP